MALITQTIKNLVAGVSQQPPILRHPEQLEEQINGYSTEAGGLQKRPPTLHKFRTGLTASEVKPRVHFINRDATEQYAVVFTGSDIVVYDILTGEQKVVSFKDDSAKAYITSQQPRKDLKAVTIADYTFITNMKVNTKMRSAVAPNVWASQGLLVNVKSGQYGRTYKIVVNGETVATFETPDGSQATHVKQINTDYIVDQLAAAAKNAGWTTAKGTSWLYLTGKTITSAEAYDGYNNQAMVCILKATQKFTNLPAAAPDGYTVKIVGEKGSLSDDYYVKYSASEQIWKETVEPGLPLGFDGATMPHVLIRQADGTFLCRAGEWTDRTTGDEDSNPEPSFIGYPINDIFFFRNRLGFLSGENIILSSNADFFRFWMSSAMAVQDTDTIDVAVSDNKISTLYQAVPHGEDLIVFSADTQFSLRADGILSPTNVKADTLTYFASEPSVKPVGVGRNIYFTTQRTNFSAVKEYFTAFDNTDKRDAQDITAHVPNYLPNGVYQLVPSTIDNILLFLTEGEPNKMYVYKYLFIDGVKQQSAWSIWDFGAEIIGASFIGSALYILIKREGSYCLEKLVVSYNTTDFDDEPYRIYVDRKVETPIITEDKYDALTNTTTITISDYYDTESMDAGTYIITTAKGVVYLNEDNQVTLQGNFAGQKLIIGVSFNFKAVMSPYIIKQSDDGSTISLNDGRLQLQHVWFNFEDSGYFKVCVNDRDYINSGYFKIIVNGEEQEELSHMKGYDTEKAYINSLYEFSTGDKLDIVLLKSGILKVPVQKQNTKAVISIESSLPTPIAIVGGGWNGRYVRRFRNV